MHHMQGTQTLMPLSHTDTHVPRGEHAACQSMLFSKHAAARKQTLKAWHGVCTYTKCTSHMFLSCVPFRGEVNTELVEVVPTALSKYARDLTSLAQQGKLDPVIGRSDEIRRWVRALICINAVQ